MALWDFAGMFGGIWDCRLFRGCCVIGPQKGVPIFKDEWMCGF